MVELKGKEEQEEQDRRFERKDGPNEMNALPLNERKRWINKINNGEEVTNGAEVKTKGAT